MPSHSFCALCSLWHYGVVMDRTSSVPVKLSRKEMLHESAILHYKNDTRQALSLMPKQVTLTRTRHHRTGKRTYCTMRDLKHRMITHRQNLKDLLPLNASSR